MEKKKIIWREDIWKGDEKYDQSKKLKE